MLKRSSLAAALLLVSCGCSGDGRGKKGSDGPAANVEEALTRLGVDINETARVDATGVPLPDSYAPMGATSVLDRIDELMLVGIKARDPNAPGSYLPGRLAWLEVEDGTTTLLHDPGAEPVWVEDEQAGDAFAQTRRAVLGADLDADGSEETLVAYVTTNAMTAFTELNVAVYEDGLNPSPYSGATSLVHTQATTVLDLRGVALDSDGDGDDDLALVLSTGTAFTVLFLVNEAGALAVDTASTRTFATVNSSVDALSSSIKSARLDHDVAEELVMTLIEYTEAPETGVARYVILDDAAHDHVLLASDYVAAFGAGQLRSAVAADVSAGDIDEDGLDEIVLGGPTEYYSTCAALTGSIHLALDDATNGFNRIGEGYYETAWVCGVPSENNVRWSFVSLLDLDGDNVPEVSIGREVYDDWSNAAPFTLIHSIPEASFETGGQRLDRNVFAVSAGDFTGDGYEELALFLPDTLPLPRIAFWGRSGSDFVEIASHPTLGDIVAANPVLLPVNVDDDSPLVRWEGTHRLVFTEPIVLAVLAAPPCFEGIGQNLDGCVTAYGTAETATTETEDVLSWTATRTLGINVDGGAATQSEASFKLTLERTISANWTSGYSRTKSIVYTTGPQEDSVVFMTVPYDRYVYTLVTHSDPDMVGAEVIVDLPRELITVMTEREFYNRSVTESALKIDETVFSHSIGDPFSYLTIAERDVILSAGDSDLVTQQATVGQGAGATEVGLAVGTEYGEGGSLALGFTVDVEATAATLVAGFSVGPSLETSVMITSGTETTYTGSVGSIPSDEFGEEHLYNFGLFTYVALDATTGQEYEVINYWVD